MKSKQEIIDRLKEICQGKFHINETQKKYWEGYRDALNSVAEDNEVYNLPWEK